MEQEVLVNELKRKKIESATSSSIVSILPSELIRCVLSLACKKCTWQLTNKPDRLCSPKSSLSVRTTPAFLCRPQRQTANSFRPTLDRAHLKLTDWRGYYLHCGFKAFTLMSWRFSLTDFWTHLDYVLYSGSVWTRWTWCDHVSSSLVLEMNTVNMRLRHTVSLMVRMTTVLLNFTNGEFPLR